MVLVAPEFLWSSLCRSVRSIKLYPLLKKTGGARKLIESRPRNGQRLSDFSSGPECMYFDPTAGPFILGPKDPWTGHRGPWSLGRRVGTPAGAPAAAPRLQPWPTPAPATVSRRTRRRISYSNARKASPFLALWSHRNPNGQEPCPASHPYSSPRFTLTYTRIRYILFYIIRNPHPLVIHLLPPLKDAPDLLLWRIRIVFPF